MPPNARVVLLTADGSFLGPAYAQDVSSDATFNIQTVLPGTYWALVDVDADSGQVRWSTVKTEVVVSGDIDHLSLSLIPN